MSENGDWLLAEAERCLRIARDCPTASVSETIRNMAAVYLERAGKDATDAALLAIQQIQSANER